MNVNLFKLLAWCNWLKQILHCSAPQEKIKKQKDAPKKPRHTAFFELP